MLLRNVVNRFFQTGVNIPEHLNFHQHRCEKLKIDKKNIYIYIYIY